MSGYPTCVDCPAPVKFRHRLRCHACHRRTERAALKRGCAQCGQLRHLREDDRCAGCLRAATPPKAPKTTVCRGCGEQRRNVGHGLCNRCMQADPDRPFRYAASLALRMQPAPPPWWHPLVVFSAARFHPGGTVAVLRETGPLLVAEPSLSPHQLMTLTPPKLTPTTLRVLTAFFTHRGLAIPPDAAQRRSAARREGHLEAVAAPLSEAVAAFNQTQMRAGPPPPHRAAHP